MTAKPSTTAETSGHPYGLVVRETACKTILNRSSISDYTLNCYTGCSHGCVYCYARFIERFHPHPEAWGRFVDVKVNAAEALRRQLRRAEPGRVFVSSACDGWQPIEAERRLTRRCCELLLDYGFQVNVLTKSRLVLRDLDVLSGRTARVGVTITTRDERLARLWEPRCSGVEERFEVIAEARRAGLKTAIMFGPLLPLLSDDQASIDALFARAADLRVDELFVDALNPRPKVWPSVAELLRERFPGLRERYQRVLFDRRERERYVVELRDRVARAARRYALTDRLTCCP
jgi:DNA repair photolyase